MNYQYFLINTILESVALACVLVFYDIGLPELFQAHCDTAYAHSQHCAYLSGCEPLLAVLAQKIIDFLLTDFDHPHSFFWNIFPKTYIIPY